MSATAISDEERAALAPLLRSLRRLGHSFSFHVIAAPVGARERLQQAIGTAALEDASLPILSGLPRGAAGVRAIEELLRGVWKDSNGVVILDGDALLAPEHATVLGALNLARDRLQEILAGPLILVLTDENMGRLQRDAPDIFNIRATQTAFPEAITDSQPDWVNTANRPELWAADGTSLLELAEPREHQTRRAEELESRLLKGEAAGAPDGALADGWLQVAVCWRDLVSQKEGRSQAAFVRAQSAIARARFHAERSSYERALAFCDTLDAEVLMCAGEVLVDNERIRSALDTFVRLGSQRDVGNAWLMLARSVRETQPDEAVRIVREHALPALREARDGVALASTTLRMLEGVRLRRSARAAARIFDEEWPQIRPLLNLDSHSKMLAFRSSLHQFCGELDRAILLAEEAVRLAREDGDTNQRVHALVRAAMAHASRLASLDRKVAALELDEAERLSKTHSQELARWVAGLAPLIRARLALPRAPNRRARRHPR